MKTKSSVWETVYSKQIEPPVRKSVSLSGPVGENQVAAKMGHGSLVERLFVAGARWNALDKAGHCAGEYAIEAGRQDVADKLIEAGQHICTHGLQYSLVLLATS